jgi:hypothetical protein
MPVALVIEVAPHKSVRANPETTEFRGLLETGMVGHGFEVLGGNVSGPPVEPGNTIVPASFADLMVIFELVENTDKDVTVFQLGINAFEPDSARKVAAESLISDRFQEGDVAERSRALKSLASTACSSLAMTIRDNLRPPRACGRHMWVVVERPPKNFDIKLNSALKKRACWQALTYSTRDQIVFHVHTNLPVETLTSRLKNDLALETKGLVIESAKETILIRKASR